MDTDVWLEKDRLVLDGETILLEGTSVATSSNSVSVQSPSVRRKNDGSRRALVHDKNDGLTVNFGADYPGGVTIGGRLQADGLSLRVIEQKGGKPGLPKDGRVGELIVTRDTKFMDKMPIGESVSLWLCVGERVTLGGLGGVYWQPVELGKAVKGTD